MGNHTVECTTCGHDLRGLSSGHAPHCPGEGASPTAIEQFQSRGRRPDGFYYVYIADAKRRWHIAYWNEYYWEMCRNPHRLQDSDFTRIGGPVWMPDE